jgi:hypothetical protein
MWRIGWAPNSIPIYIQQDATLQSLFISGNCSTCFGWYFHPSSGAHTTVCTASGICHTVTAICRYQLEPVWVCCGWRAHCAVFSEFSRAAVAVSRTQHYAHCAVFSEVSRAAVAVSRTQHCAHCALSQHPVSFVSIHSTRTTSECWNLSLPWRLISHRMVNIYRRFGRSLCLCVVCKELQSTWTAYLWRWMQHIHSVHQLWCARRHGVTYSENNLPAMRTSDLR